MVFIKWLNSKELYMQQDNEISVERSVAAIRATFTSVFFLGIGGIGMSALARYFMDKGYNVSGYDKTISPLTIELEKEGIKIIYDESVSALPENVLDREQTLVVRTPAVPLDHEQYVWFLEHGYMILKRSEVLGVITRQMQSLCVAGTHGKTTTSTILAHLLYQSEIGTNAFLGGISLNYRSNLLLNKDSSYVVVEADEFDHSFHQLSPYISIITSADPDHLDIYGDAAGFKEGFEYYTSLIKKGGALLLKQGVDIKPRLQQGVKLYTYCGQVDKNSDSPLPDFYADNVVVNNGEIHFDYVTPNERIENLKLGVPVWVNIENSVAAMAVAWLCGVTETELRVGLASYSGIYRRFNIHVNTKDIVYIDDYAHHPTELHKSIESIRRLYPKMKLTGVFQPHLYTRTRDFAEGFARELSQLDEVILLPIYPARENPIEGVDSKMLLDKITCEKKSIVEKPDLIKNLSGRHGEVIVTLGAGDIDRLVPEIAKSLMKK